MDGLESSQYYFLVHFLSFVDKFSVIIDETLSCLNVSLLSKFGTQFAVLLSKEWKQAMIRYRYVDCVSVCRLCIGM